MDSVNEIYRKYGKKGANMHTVNVVQSNDTMNLPRFAKVRLNKQKQSQDDFMIAPHMMCEDLMTEEMTATRANMGVVKASELYVVGIDVANELRELKKKVEELIALYEEKHE